MNTKPNMLDLIKYRIENTNGTLVKDKKDATITYGFDGCTHSMDRVDEILAEML